MKSFADVIKAPIITEKSATIMEDGKYTFEVAPTANKTEVKQAVEAAFSVKVEKVNIQNNKPKKRRVGRYVGKTAKVRKAVVTLKEGHSIEIYGE